MHAEPLGVRSNNVGGLASAHSPLPMGSGSPVHAPLSHGMAAELASVQDSLANMGMPRVASNNGVEELHMGSPGAHAGAFKLCVYVHDKEAYCIVFVHMKHAHCRPSVMLAYSES